MRKVALSYAFAQTLLLCCLPAWVKADSPENLLRMSASPEPLLPLSGRATQEKCTPTKRGRLSLGAFLPTNVPASIDTEFGYSLELGTAFHVYGTGRWIGSLRYSRYVASPGQNISLINPLLEYHWTPGGDQGFYGGLGAGAIIGHNSLGGNSSSFAYSLALGVNFADSFLEARWVGGYRAGEHGVIIGAGLRF